MDDEIKKINDKLNSKLGNKISPVLLGGYGSDQLPTIVYNVYEFEIFNNKIHAVTFDINVPYFKEYIENVINGNPDKISIIRKYATEVEGMSQATFDKILSTYGESNIPSRITKELELFEKSIRPIIDSIIREKKIDSLLNDSDLT